MRKKNKKVIQRNVIGIRLLTGKAPPVAYLLYRFSWDDGTTTTERGFNIHTIPGSEHLNGTARQRKITCRNLRTDLYENIVAASILLQPVETACANLDNSIGILGDPT